MGLERSLVAMPVIDEAFHGAERALVDCGARPSILHMPDLAQLPADLWPEQLDGLILTGAMVKNFGEALNTKAVSRLKRLPTVWVIGDPPGAWGDSVVSDDFAVGAGAAEKLVMNGHRNLAFLNPVPRNLLFARREDGFYATARRLGAQVQSFSPPIEQCEQLPLQAPTSRFDVVQTLVDQFLKSNSRCTAIFTAADSVAALAYCALGMRGVRVGQDVSIIGGNNTPGLMSVPYPHLATFDIHSREMGTLAVRQLATQIAERDNGTYVPRQIVLRPTFVPGESVRMLGARASKNGR
jgi:DNA-binding LacI/PurR family transcriptional regulator